MRRLRKTWPSQGLHLSSLTPGASPGAFPGTAPDLSVCTREEMEVFCLKTTGPVADLRISGAALTAETFTGAPKILLWPRIISRNVELKPSFFLV